ncbi:acyl carrier protein 2, mitochondrial-like [Senna tora]|uniref:Acyl carrier protein 2, mitochondrial-like n=1 Tax=Senna tora TaxID=362788 RepID=A0A834WFA0_9FABA|nr:acyl carrier protein 2, mitochondrial-like [Senna tora]
MGFAPLGLLISLFSKFQCGLHSDLDLWNEGLSFQLRACVIGSTVPIAIPLDIDIDYPNCLYASDWVKCVYVPVQNSKFLHLCSSNKRGIRFSVSFPTKGEDWTFLDHVQLLKAMEEEFVVDIPDYIALKISTIAHLIHYIAGHPQTK